jgi:uncharacterized protein YbjT (DUF2867 family)
VAAVKRLSRRARQAGVRRLVHVSVAGTRDDPRRPYLASKWRGEQVVMASGLAWTIVRPGVIAAPGDDFVTNLAAMLRQAAVFPAPAAGHAPLAAGRGRGRGRGDRGGAAPAGGGRACFDVVGPERLPLRAWVLRVAAALELRVVVLPVPAVLLGRRWR